MNETPLFLTICETHHTLGKSDWLGANHLANEHADTYKCYEPVHVVHERPWNVGTNDSDEIKQLGQEAVIIYQYGTP